MNFGGFGFPGSFNNANSFFQPNSSFFTTPGFGGFGGFGFPGFGGGFGFPGGFGGGFGFPGFGGFGFPFHHFGFPCCGTFSRTSTNFIPNTTFATSPFGGI